MPISDNFIVLNRLFTAQSIIYAMPDEKKIAAFAASAIKLIPGVEFCSIYLIETDEFYGDAFEGEWQRERLKDVRTYEGKKSNIVKIELNTTDYAFGEAYIACDDLETIKIFESPLANFISIASLNLENVRQRKIMDTFNRSLQSKIEEATKELQKEIDARRSSEEAEKRALEEAEKALEIASRSRKVLLSLIEDEKKAKEDLNKLNKELEERVALRTSQLEAANNELEAFAYSISHDLRAPLRGIHGFTQILIEDYSAKFDEEGLRLCQVIKDNSVKMSRLIDDLLAFSRVGRVELSKSLIDMQTMANSIFHEITDEAQRKAINFRINEIPPVFGDTNLIRQVWINLISNAVKFSSRREDSVIEIGMFERDGRSFYYVKDNGAGFNEKYKNKLFGVFQRLHSDQEFTGTGVGLALVQRIINRHGGLIAAESEIDKGALFYFYLPEIIN